jgi:GR25 family glycosyltransferase involved in LPS biosynthesis
MKRKNMMLSYIISLNNPINLINEVKSYGFKTVLIEGVRGNKLSYEEKIKETGNQFIASTIPDSVLGCALAHIKTWKTFLSSNEPYCVIFEDDAVFEPNFKNNFDLYFKHTPSDFDIFYIGCLHNINFTDNNINEYIKIPDIFLGLHSYVISRKGVEKLLKHIDKNIYTHIDFMIKNLNSKIIIYSATKRLVYQTSTDNPKTSLNTSNNFPLIVDYLSSFVEIDKKLRLNYILLCPLIEINGYIINAIPILFLIIGIICHRVPINILLSCFIILSLPDIFSLKNIYEFFVNGMVFLFPALYYQTMLD